MLANGAATEGERESRICVGWVASSSLSEYCCSAAGGGEDETIGSRRYIVYRTRSKVGIGLERSRQTERNVCAMTVFHRA